MQILQQQLLANH